MTDLITYKLPDDIKKYTEYFEIESSEIGFKINTHSDNFEKGQAILTQNLFTYILNGKKEVLHSSGKLILNKNESAILKKGSYLVSERIDTDEDFKNLLFFFSDKFIEKVVSTKKAANNNKGDIYQKILDNYILKELIFNIETYLSSDLLKEDKDILLKLKAEELLMVLKTIAIDVAHFLICITNEKSNKLIDVFEKHYTDHLHLSDYAHLTGLSLSSLKRQFKHELNTTPMKWITERRLIDAKELMIEQNLSITEIAFRLGFESLSHFSRLFKAKYKKNPSAYRNELFI